MPISVVIFLIFKYVSDVGNSIRNVSYFIGTAWLHKSPGRYCILATT